MKVNIHNLIKKYNDKIILDIENLEIEEGKITGITGHNGSGKSTLLNIISNIDKDYCGKITYDDRIIDTKVKTNMTYVFQKPYLFRRKVLDNIIYPLKIRNYNKSEIVKLSNKIIENLEIEDLIDKKGHKLSGGESQKVALARSLIFKPKLLLLDEPTSNIDPEYIVTMEREIIRFNKETKGTVIIVTHNIEQSERLCHNIINLHNGKRVV